MGFVASGTEETTRASYTVGIGVDLGRKQDHTAVAVAEMRRLATPRPDGSETLCLIRQWERYPLGLEWKAISTRIARTVEGVLDILWQEWHVENDARALSSMDAARVEPEDYGQWRRPPLPSVKLHVDATGVGDPVVHMILGDIAPRHEYQEHIIAKPCFFTLGDRLTRNNGSWSVGKGYMVGDLTMLIERELIKVAPDTYHAEEAIEELLEYEGRIDERANEKYGAFSVGSHDDLVTALGLAVLDLKPDWRSKVLVGGFN